MSLSLNFPRFNLEEREETSTLYHVGTLDITRKRPFSCEGNGLSVSICPNAWEKITRQTEGILWGLTKKDAQFLDFHQLTDAQKQVIIDWGIQMGYVENTTVYKVEEYDEYGDIDHYSIYQ